MRRDDDDDLLLIARLVAASFSGLLLTVLVLAAVIALFDRENDAGEFTGVLAIAVPALVGLVGFALGLPRIIGAGK